MALPSLLVQTNYYVSDRLRQQVARFKDWLKISVTIRSRLDDSYEAWVSLTRIVWLRMVPLPHVGIPPLVDHFYHQG
jgi:hypothetical protein